MGKKFDDGSGNDALRLHSFYNGKVEVNPKCAVRDLDDMGIWYTPGVAEPCKEIKSDVERSYEYTNRGNSIAVVSDGSRVLGLGDIGPEAGLPVMEGKALLFKYLGGVDAYPLCLDVSGVDELVETVKRLAPSLGGVNLEDIESPKCFSVLESLRDELDIPVWHDDQQGTALVSIAGLLGALKVVGKDIEDIKLAVIGAGAAGVNNTRYAIEAGVKPENIKIVDKDGVLRVDRDDIGEDDYKYEWALRTNPDNLGGGISEALRGADACIAASAPGPGIIEKSDVEKMGPDAIVFAEANPVPEILPEDAKEAGAKIVGTGRSDYPNQVNNSLGFPAVFRGSLEVEASDITDEMCIAAAYAIAERAEERGLSEDFVIPDMNDLEMYVKEAVAVGRKAIEQGVARKELTEEELEENSREKFKKARRQNELAVENGLIKLPKEE